MKIQIRESFARKILRQSGIGLSEDLIEKVINRWEKQKFIKKSRKEEILIKLNKIKFFDTSGFDNPAIWIEENKSLLYEFLKILEEETGELIK